MIKDNKMKRDKLAKYEKLIDEIIESLEDLNDNESSHGSTRIFIRMLVKKIKKEIELIDNDEEEL
jgi:hypothetical protein